MTSVKGGNSTGPANVAIDTVAAEDFQRVKLVDGTIGSSTAAGISSNPLYVSVASTVGPMYVNVNSGSVTATGTVNVSGDIAAGIVDSGNPAKIGYRGVSALPTQVANAQRANAISDLWGRQLVSHIDPAMATWKHFAATSTAVGHMIWNPAAGKRIAVTNLQIGTTGTVASDLTVWFGDASDTTYTEGTDQVLFDGTFVPSSSAAPGAVNSFNTPVFCTTADRKLRLSMPSSMQAKITVQGYEW